MTGRAVGARSWRWGALAAGVVGSSLASALPLPATGPAVTLSVAAAIGATSFLVIAEWRRPVLPRRAIAAAVGVVLVVSVMAPPRRSQDLWAYATYGEMVVQYQANPYIHRPAEFPRDAMVQRMAGWRASRTVYGPVFTGLSAGIVAATGGHPLPTRLAFQLLAAASIAGCLLVLARRRNDPGPLLLLGLHPVVAFYVVNGGHNDALLALLVLGATIAATRRRPGLAGVLVGLAVGIKAIALLPLAALAWWTWRHHGRRAAMWLGGVAAGMTTIGYAVVGGLRALSPLLAASGYSSRASMWQPVRRFLAGAHVPSHGLGLVATAAVLAVGALLVAASRDDGTPTLAVAAPLIAFVVAGSYVLPWYLIWALPLLAFVPGERVTGFYLAFSGLMVLAFQYQAGAHGVVNRMVSYAIPATQLTEIVGLGMLAVAAVERIRVARAAYAA